MSQHPILSPSISQRNGCHFQQHQTTNYATECVNIAKTSRHGGCFQVAAFFYSYSFSNNFSLPFAASPSAHYFCESINDNDKERELFHSLHVHVETEKIEENYEFKFKASKAFASVADYNESSESST